MFWHKSDQELFRDAYNRFTENLLVSILKENPGENVIISPISFMTLLTIAAESTSGKTKKEIEKFLSPKQKYKNFLDSLFSSADVLSGKNFQTANAVCVNQRVSASVKSDYIDHVNSDLQGKFFSSENIIQDVNQWVCEKTNGRIEYIADDSMKDMLFFLLNAVTFDGIWDETYQDDDVKPGIFKNADGTRSHREMLHCCESGYIENDKFTGFIKRYRNSFYSFMTLLPNDNGQKEMINSLAGIDFSELFDNVKWGIVKTSMPKFQIDFDKDLTAYCKKSGINDLFSPSANFSPMTSEKIMAESVLHKAFICVDEAGTMAGAVSAMIYMRGLPSPKKYKVDLNRPFIFVIMHDESMIPVFAGIVNHLDDQKDHKH